jgi:aspartyl-tRNA(Asn)/glutamyl-tRNA(Gln) amidotransferase subunit B
MEVVSEPDIRSPAAAGAYVRKLSQVMQQVGTCDGKMAEGSLRVDVNVSVRPEGETSCFGERTEVKNVNSVRHVMKAIEYESQRHVEILENGGKIEVSYYS